MPWETDDSAGFFRLEGEHTVTDAEWGTNPAYDADAVLLMLHFEIRDPEFPDTTHHVEQFGIGKAWSRSRDGKKVEHESGETDKKFRSNSQYGRMLKTLTANSPELIEEVVGEGGDPVECAIWVGRRFLWEQIPSNPGADTEEGRKKTKASATKYIHTGKKASAKGSGPAKVADNGSGDTTALRKRLIKLAVNSESHDDFIDVALRHAKGTDLEAEVLDESEDGFFAKANA